MCSGYADTEYYVQITSGTSSSSRRDYLYSTIMSYPLRRRKDDILPMRPDQTQQLKTAMNGGGATEIRQNGTIFFHFKKDTRYGVGRGQP